jgi:hypothetical protein
MAFAFTPEKRADLEFRAFQESLGAAPTSEHVLIPPSELDAGMTTLWLGEQSPGTSTTAIFRYRDQSDYTHAGAADVANKTSFNLTTFGVTNPDKLVALELADEDKYLRVGIIRATPAAAIPTAIKSDFSLDSTNQAEVAIVSATLPTGALRTGSTFRIVVRGIIDVTANSGSLTFTPYIGTTAAQQKFEMLGRVNDDPVRSFYLTIDATVRTVNSSAGNGSYVASGHGRIDFAAAPKVLQTTNITSEQVDTSAVAPVVKLTAKWGPQAAGTSTLKVPTATIEQIV